MSLYRKFAVAFWEGELAAQLSEAGDSDGFTVCTYLITNRYNTWGLGLYRMPLVLISDTTGIALETVRRCVRDASERRFAHYDDARKTVWVVEQTRHEWATQSGECSSPGANNARAMIRDLPEIFHNLRKSYLAKDFLSHYGDWMAPILDACDPHPERVVNASATRPQRITDRDAQDQDQDQDQDQETGGVRDANSGPWKRAAIPGSAADLSFPTELLRAVPDFQDRWTESRRKRALDGRVTWESQQDQIDKLARWAGKHGAAAVRQALEDANEGSWKKLGSEPGTKGSRVVDEGPQYRALN